MPTSKGREPRGRKNPARDKDAAKHKQAERDKQARIDAKKGKVSKDRSGRKPKSKGDGTDHDLNTL